MRIIYFISILIITLSGCKIRDASEIEQQDPKKSEPNNIVPLKQTIYSGMYEVSGGNARFRECETGRTFVVSKDGDNRVFEIVYKTFQTNNPGKRLFISAEGFSSVQQNSKSQAFDSVLVVTRVIETDTLKNCE